MDKDQDIENNNEITQPSTESVDDDNFHAEPSFWDQVEQMYIDDSKEIQRHQVRRSSVW